MQQKIWRCNAGCPDFITISSFPPVDDKDFYSAYLMVEYFSKADSFLERIKAAFNILRGRRHLWCEIDLEHCAHEIVEELTRLQNVITKAKDDYGRAN